jgi:uracil-DNA glycosylase
MNQTEKLQKLADEIIREKTCADLAKQATQLVMGEGDPNARVVFIGEAPGKDEDIQGKPFVGASGRLLNKMLETIGLSRAEVYITNIVKYRPPNNRDPKPEEKAAFRQYLDRQIEIIQPEILVTLGRHSLNEFLPAAKISAVHGTLNTGYKIPVFALYHPAAVLYAGGGNSESGMYKAMLADFHKLKEILEKPKS